MAAPPAAKWKNDKTSQSKREVPAMLEPLEYKPTPKEDIDVMQLSKASGSSGVMDKPNREGSKHIKPRPVLLESLGPPSQYNFVTQQPRAEPEEGT